MSEARFIEKIQRLIRANGPLSVAEYMAVCLGDPEHGYYATRDPFGRAGDFTTAPEISQMFGEILGAWLVEAWRGQRAPAPVRLVELGPGRGTLMADLLRVLAQIAPARSAASVHLVETSPTLRKIQRETLKTCTANLEWHTSLQEVPAGPMLLVANEFFDALPIRQFVRLDAWRERVIGLDARGRLSFGVGPAVLEDAPDAPRGSIFETRPSAEGLAAEIAARIAADGGAALVIDYGHAETSPGDTLQAVAGHAYADPLADPGACDLTAHVDFAALVRAAERAGAACHGPMPQGEFLTALGLRERAGRLSAADEATRIAISSAAERLAAADQMGALFKVLAITPRGVLPPPFEIEPRNP